MCQCGQSCVDTVIFPEGTGAQNESFLKSSTGGGRFLVLKVTVLGFSKYMELFYLEDQGKFDFSWYNPFKVCLNIMNPKLFWNTGESKLLNRRESEIVAWNDFLLADGWLKRRDKKTQQRWFGSRCKRKTRTHTGQSVEYACGMQFASVTEWHI